MNKKRPVNLDLTTIKFPPMAIASILHRISGVVLFLLLPVIIYFLDLSLRNAGTFSNLQMLLEQFHWKLLLWVFLAALIYHVLAGIRHVLMDIGYGEHLKAGRLSALAVIILAVILTIFAGIWIW
ncbi:succinate dehydrogenase, cytochrome b556 subunit [Legionella spiritensis]|uniref:Succinate dehydrogenase cytochrome b556 subunit n=1 Tax=Legionella spiritensis TaxID=452 RepID=A0A0W0Z6Y8_LEGSP|nr:succinate dehydrogenase, cytochrome b556 subunit [Legionella spiritensis]KTD64687.1 succinate dehydrogenase cytochrome b556 subunit C [Legionella spiritensis]SNV47885.1 succinate dehydrogenase cytochrome b556 subunit C [Legionella spiritensis]VEG91367.1 succinate dehydrogenase cytochrome b556 subunit C [Legionella spiritensis]